MSTHAKSVDPKAAVLEILREGPATASEVRARLAVNQAIADQWLAEMADSPMPLVRRVSLVANDSTTRFELIPVQDETPNPLD